MWIWGENIGRVKSWAHSLVCNTLGVEGHARVAGWDYEEWQAINHSHGLAKTTQQVG
jgi:hypothetical protein